MLSQDIASVRATLGVLAGRIDPEDWHLVVAARNELDKLANDAKMMELELCIPPYGGDGEAPNYAA